MVRTVLGRAMMALLVLAPLAACSDGGSDAARDADVAAEASSSTTSAEPETTTTTRPCVAGDLDPRSLEPLIVEDVDGFAQQPDEVGDTGPSDLAKAVRDDGQPDAEPTLQGDGFRAGYQRLWLNDADEELVLFVYEFCKPDGTRRYAGRLPRIFQRAGVPTQPVTSRASSGGFMAIDGSSRGVWLWRTTDTTLVLVITFSVAASDAGALVERADGLLAAQLDRLAELDASVI